MKISIVMTQRLVMQRFVQCKASIALTIIQGNNDLFALAHKRAWQGNPLVKVPVSLRKKQQFCFFVFQQPWDYVVLGKVIIRRNRLRGPADEQR